MTLKGSQLEFATSIIAGANKPGEQTGKKMMKAKVK